MVTKQNELKSTASFGIKGTTETKQAKPNVPHVSWDTAAFISAKLHHDTTFQNLTAEA